MKDNNAFTPEEQSHLCQMINDHCYSQNFGRMSKSDLETLLFPEYIEHCLNQGLPFDDYTLSKQLGITQTRVRSLKEKKELQFPREGFDWKRVFAENAHKAAYVNENHRVCIVIEDINVLREVQHFIEQRGWFDECHLNRKVLQISISCFVDLCMALKDGKEVFDEKARKKIESIRLHEDWGVLAEELLNDFSAETLKVIAEKAGKAGIIFAGEVLKRLVLSGISW